MRVQLRRSIGFWLTLPLAAVAAIASLQFRNGSTIVWSLAAAAIGLTMVIVVPLSAGLAAYAGTRARRQGTEGMERLSARGQGRAVLPELGALMIWVLIADVVLIASIYIPTALHAQWGAPPVWRTAASLVALLAMVVIGFVVGRLLPFRITAPAVVVAVYAVDYLFDSWANTVGVLAPTDQNIYDQYRGPNPITGLAQILWFAGLAATVYGIWALRHALRTVAAVALVIPLAVTASGLSIALTSGRDPYAPARIIWTCDGTAPQLCLHPAFEQARPDVSAAVAPVVERLTDTPFAVQRLEQRPRGVGSEPNPGAVGFALDDLRPQSIHNAALDVAANALGLDIGQCIVDDKVSDSYFYTDLVATYVALGSVETYNPIDDKGKTAKQQFARLLDPSAWLATHASELRDCTLTAQDFAPTT